MKSNQKFFYGWWIVARSFILNFITVGILLNAVGLFVKPVTESLGFTRGAFLLYCSISMLSLIVTVPILGKLLERYNISLVMTICATISAFVEFAVLARASKS